MARTPLFGAMRRALSEAGLAAAPRALTRRHFLAMTAALAACGPRAQPGSIAANAPRGVAIVGAGAAGLTVAYRLSQAGRPAILYEASNRLGGRMFTRRNFNEDGQFCELGGELVDSNHAALRRLAREVDVAIDRLAPENDPGQDLYHIGRRLYAQDDMLDRRGHGAFREAARRIGADRAALLDADENWTERARELDRTSLAAYLASLRDVARPWVLTLLDLAYHGEYGAPTDQQSALNFVDFVGVELSGGFKMFGESDEIARIRGGSSTLIDALAAKLGPPVALAPRHALTGLARIEGGVRLAFDSPEGPIEREHDAVVLALPFTRLRAVRGLDELGLGEPKLNAIRNLGYGDNAKIMVSTRARPWKAEAREFPKPSNGTFYSDSGMQCVWETSRGQDGARGILTNFLAGVQDESQFAKLAAGLQAIAPDIADSLDISKRAVMFWARQPHALGSYACAKVGQYTTLLEHCATPAHDGRIQFAGEHTSVDFMGFMNGAVESGERAAAALLGA